MKKGLLQRASKEVLVFASPEVKKENNASSSSNMMSSETNKSIITPTPNRKTEIKSMIAIRKDYSHKYITPTKSKTLTVASQENFCDYLGALKPIKEEPDASNYINREIKIEQPLKLVPLEKQPVKRSLKPPSKSTISILQRYDYDKDPLEPKIIKYDEKPSSQILISAIKTPTVASPIQFNLNESFVPLQRIDINDYKVKERKTSAVNSRVTMEKYVEPKIPVFKKQPKNAPSKSTSTESKDSQNINKINNKINIIFKLNDNSKSLRKNIILHRRTPKKMVQKITIKEANNNNSRAQSEESNIPERITHSVETQTNFRKLLMDLTNANPLLNEPTEHLFFEHDVLISIQQKTISFFEFDRLGCLLKKGRNDFKLIDRISRRVHDTQVDADNKFQRICYNVHNNSLPIYVEMRAKQKELDDPEMCPFAFLYCNIYYIDSEQRKAKFSSVHLDTVKGIFSDITYTTVPGTSYFIMAWVEKSMEEKNFISGIVKYKLTPNLDLAKLASIRQFPKLNYRIRQMNCSKGSQLITNGDSQISIFNYDSGDLLMSLDLVKSYGTNLTTFGYKENFLFMVQLSDGDDDATKHINVICVNKCDGNTFKVIQSSTLRINEHEKIVSKSITSTNHLIVTFSSGSAVMLNLCNFREIHCERSKNESLFAAGDHLLVASRLNIGLSNFSEYFLNMY